MYYSNYQKNAPKREDVLASATKIVLDEFSKTDSCIRNELNSTAYKTIRAKPTQTLEKVMIPNTPFGIGMGIAEFPPFASKGRHYHTNVEVVYVLEGKVTVAEDGMPEKKFKAGESFQHPAYVIHDTKAGPKGAKVIATWVFESGKPVSIPVK